ncbi:hypothetical protein SARC_05861 [Sphaeroforma arctica JP610]|uniref:RNA helicase n=1 Tax=Sphaeroforma arctica JP610 TaxID=667725 RepID=A0A0L0FZ40_9EUKA|nr:hypothetical protein SARC_05861 [Sphaeroforma arctica JP610]KNC81841.1 hypothetical protein SARC_05861 [Sphaeroforma arctica JP610]|eukprot:XP_014155743.1 hypothetical protein SARC_05861 [Sphaeroforma arctica JP610]
MSGFVLPSFPTNAPSMGDVDEEIIRRTNAKARGAKAGTFQAMGLNPLLLKGITQKGYKVPTPIQRKTIPLGLEGRDVVAMARTGSGKSAAFLIPLFEKLLLKKTTTMISDGSKGTGVRSLVLSPTRELALQTLGFIKDLGKHLQMRSCLIVGGDSIEDQFTLLHNNPDIVVATPGRLTHLLVEMNLPLSACEYVVFDECDRLFEMGFEEQVKEISARLPADRQTMLFSATLPRTLVDFAQAGLKDPVLIRLDVDTKLPAELKLSFYSVRQNDRLALLLHILRTKISEDEKTLVFVATKHHVEFMRELLETEKILCSYCYGSLDMTARKIQVAKFRSGKAPVLIVTDVAARGIDIPQLDNVIMYDFSPSPKLFVHRVGRVARAGRHGSAYCMVMPEEVPYYLDLMLFLGRDVRIAGRLNRGNTDTSDDTDNIIGTVPEILLMDLREHVKELHKSNYDLGSVAKTVENAYQMYNKSRPKPSSASVRRAKDEIVGHHVAIHPDFLGLVDEHALAASEILKKVAGYKSANTVFETSRLKNSAAADAMKKKRQIHSGVIEKVKKQKQERKEMETAEIAKLNGNARQGDKKRKAAEMETASDQLIGKMFGTIIDPAKRSRDYKKDEETHEDDDAGAEFEDMHDDEVNNAVNTVTVKRSKRDETNYIPYQSKNHHHETGLALGDSFVMAARDAVVEFTGDDDGDLRKQTQKKKWDRKKKKYVGEANDDPTKKKVKTESGNYINASYRGNLYSEWKNKHHVTGGAGESSLPQITGARGRGRGNYKQGNQKQQKSEHVPLRGKGPQNRVKEEMKNKDQMLKTRKKTQRVKEHLQKVEKKKAAGKRGGGGGSKGKGKGGR